MSVCFAFVSAMPTSSAFSPFCGAQKRTLAPWGLASFSVSHASMASLSSGSSRRMTSCGMEVVAS